MAPLSTISTLALESLSHPGVEGLAIFALMSGLAAFAEFDRMNLKTVCFCWAIAPILWGAFLFAETSSLLLASVGVFTLWFLPGLGFVLIAMIILLLSADVYHWLFTPA